MHDLQLASSKPAWKSSSRDQVDEQELLALAQLYDVVDDRALRWVIEHEGRWQVHAQLLVQSVPEAHTCETVHSALHERAVLLHLFVGGKRHLNHFRHSLLDPLRIKSRFCRSFRDFLGLGGLNLVLDLLLGLLRLSRRRLSDDFCEDFDGSALELVVSNLSGHRQSPIAILLGLVPLAVHELDFGQHEQTVGLLRVVPQGLKEAQSLRRELAGFRQVVAEDVGLREVHQRYRDLKLIAHPLSECECRF
mmetsp:Transcript_60096/g.127314  ORF Transcript_60096/g.127314 Transcript_60096/m.127314 type:complete len:249 (-) Transcript_60096:1927-2673(-)